MEHEAIQLSWSAPLSRKKYNIEIEESLPDPKEELMRDEKESLFVINTFCPKNFSESLFDTEEGRSIGKVILKSEDLRKTPFAKFQLGYSLNEWSAFTDLALKNGYKEEFLENRAHDYKWCRKKYDRFRGRVMFPIHNLSGRVIGLVVVYWRRWKVCQICQLSGIWNLS